MSNEGTKLHETFNKDGSHHSWLFRCPACKEPHQCDGRWTWNGSITAPSFGIGQEAPSVLVTANYGPSNEKRVCHSIVTDGKITFLDDCTHSLRGTVDLPDWSW